jgi:hypothetical protein
MARAAARDSDLEKSVRRLGRLHMRSQAAIDRQVRRKEQIDSQALLVTDAVLTETIRRVRLVRPDADLSPLEKELKRLRTMRYKRKEADAFSRDLRALAPEGDMSRGARARPNTLAASSAGCSRCGRRLLPKMRPRRCEYTTGPCARYVWCGSRNAVGPR